MSAASTRDAALDAIRAGYAPVPIPRGEKSPGFTGWQKLRLTEADVSSRFEVDGNIGLLTGSPSRNLHDVDLDCPEAIHLADAFLPETGREHGRTSKPRSHRWYIGDEAGPVLRLSDPEGGDTLVELRGTGGQTLIPPSVHPSGEAYEWNKSGEPAAVKLAALRASVERLAAASLLARRYPEKRRHEFTLALAGFLLRRKMSATEVEDFILKIAHSIPGAARPEDVAHIRANVKDTEKKIGEGKPATGGNALADFLSEKTTARLVEWLGLTEVKSATGRVRLAGVYDIAGVLEKEAYTGPRFPTRLKPLDELLRAPGALIGGGLIPGRVVFFNGGPGAGKTTLETQISLEMAKQGLRLVMLLDDEPREAVAERLGQGLGFTHFELASPTRSTLAALREEQEKIDLKLLPDPDDEVRLTIEDAADYLLSVPNERAYVLAIDSLHKATCRAETDSDTERSRIDKKISVLRHLRKQGVLVLATAEANRGSYAAKDPAARSNAMASGAESRAFEFAADLLLFLEKGEGSFVRIEVPKNRIGRRLGTFSVVLNEGAARFEAIDEASVEAEKNAEKARREREREEKVETRVLGVIKSAKDPTIGRSKTEVVALVGGRPKDAYGAIARLKDSSAVEAYEVPRPRGGTPAEWLRIPSGTGSKPIETSRDFPEVPATLPGSQGVGQTDASPLPSPLRGGSVDTATPLDDGIEDSLLPDGK